MTVEAKEISVAERALPWERIQTTFPEGTKFQEAIEQMDLNYEVEPRPLWAAGTGPQGGLGLVERHMATVRKDTNTVLGVVGNRYQIVQNKEAFAFLTDIVDSGDIVPLGAGYWKGGARPWVQARLPQDIVIDKVEDERIIPFIFAGTSHDGSMPVTISLTGIRIICKNTYSANVHAPRRFQIRHLSSVSGRIEEARRVLGISFRYFEEYKSFMNQLAGVKLVDEQFRKIVDKLLPLVHNGTDLQNENVAKKRAELLGLYLNSPTVPRGTKYGGLQAITEWYDHVKNGQRFKGTRAADERKSSELLLGDAINFKDRAVELLLAR
jgi:phage/plasmid-like protein (TIGR03299 family)